MENLKGYKAVMSNGIEIKVDGDEIEAVVKLIAAGKFTKVRQGIINPSYLVGIVEDVERRNLFLHDTKHYPPEIRNRGYIPLEDIFKKKQKALDGAKTLPASPPGGTKIYGKD